MALTGSFLSKFSSDRRFSLPFPFLWTVTIDDDNLPNTINNATNKINQNWSVSSSAGWTDKLSDNILVAQEVSLPAESVEIASLTHENRGAFMPGYGVTQRTEFISRSVTINFLETEKDIETELFRPWIIALSVDGLLNQQLKSTITLKQYTRDGKIRKTYKFTGVFPTNSEGYNLTYGDQEFLVKTVTFGYTNYTVTIGSGNTSGGSSSGQPQQEVNSTTRTSTQQEGTRTKTTTTQTIRQQYVVRQGQFYDLAGNPLTGESLASAQQTQARVDAGRQRLNAARQRLFSRNR